jgi:heme oxygenase
MWIEERLFSPFDEFLATADYRRFLSLLYGFQAPLEAELARTEGIPPAFLAERRRAAYIANDLLALGLTKHEQPLLARRQHIAPFTSVGEALGWMSLTERLMQSVETLRERIEVDMPVVYALSNQFLCCYQYAINRRLRELGAMLERHAKPNADAIIAGAQAASASLQHWLEMSAPRRNTGALARLIA